MRAILLFIAMLVAPVPQLLFSQSLGNVGTIMGTIVDPSGAAVAGADVSLHNLVSGYTQAAKSGSDGTFKLTNVPPNSYHLEISAPGFNPFSQEVIIRS